MRQLVPSFAVAQVHWFVTRDELGQTILRDRVGNVCGDLLAVRVVGSELKRRRRVGVVVEIAKQLVSGSEGHYGEAFAQPVWRFASIITGSFDEGECTGGVLE